MNSTTGAAELPEALAQRLRAACESVRAKSYPLSDLIPLMQQAADALRAQAAPAVAVPSEQDADLERTIDQRDTAEGWADGLACLIGKYFGRDIGEHSSAHCPWQEAKDIIEEAEPYQPAAPTPPAAPQPTAAAQEPVAYLDIGAGGYMDVGTDLTDDQLAALPKGRHMLAIIGTYGVDGYSPAPAAPAEEGREILVDMVAHLAGAASAYRIYAKRHPSQGKAETDAFFTTRVADMDKAVERGRQELKQREARNSK